MTLVEGEYEVFDFSSANPGNQTLGVNRSYSKLELVGLLSSAPVNYDFAQLNFHELSLYYTLLIQLNILLKLRIIIRTKQTLIHQSKF